MHRVTVFASFLVALFIGAPPNSAAAPMVSISVNAPVQNDSPVHIVGLRYDEGFIELTLSNASEESVLGIAILGVQGAPPGCAAEPRRFVDSGGSAVSLPIGPHKRVVISRLNNVIPGASVLVLDARHLAAASLQFQVGVVEVDFANGTKWTRRPRYLYRTPFDSALLNSDAGKCPDAPVVTRRLARIDGVRFDRGVTAPSSQGDGEGGVQPRLFFSCSLEGSKALCPF